jgi:hypothetical protein
MHFHLLKVTLTLDSASLFWLLLVLEFLLGKSWIFPCSKFVLLVKFVLQLVLFSC